MYCLTGDKSCCVSLKYLKWPKVPLWVLCARYTHKTYRGTLGHFKYLGTAGIIWYCAWYVNLLLNRRWKVEKLCQFLPQSLWRNWWIIIPTFHYKDLKLKPGWEVECSQRSSWTNLWLLMPDAYLNSRKKN